MFPWSRKKEVEQAAPSRAAAVHLDLSGPRLRFFLEGLLMAAEPHGGVERYVSALALKAALFGDFLGKGKVADLTPQQFNDLCAFITPVRRRIGGWLGRDGFASLRDGLVALLDGWSDTATCDQRRAAFVARFAGKKEKRLARDLAAEVLHFTAPDHYPLMTGWVWDSDPNTGVLREIWHGDTVDSVEIPVGDGFAVHHTLREELFGFLRENGFYRDLPFYVDVLSAHVYASYINDRGGQFLRADFQAPFDPMLHTRRLLGLDGVDTETGRTRLKLMDGTAHVIDSPKLLN